MQREQHIMSSLKGVRYDCIKWKVFGDLGLLNIDLQRNDISHLVRYPRTICRMKK